MASGQNKPWFDLVLTDDNVIAVYAEDASEAKVMRGPDVLPCRYQRGEA